MRFQTNTSRAAIVLVLLLLLSLVVSFADGHPMDENKTRSQLWIEVGAAQAARLPKTEINLLQQIYDSAIQEQAFPEAARALFQKINTESQINQPSAPFAIKKLQSELKTVPPSLKPIANAVLANWTYTYFQSNRWRFQQRSQTGTDISADVETWDLRRILSAVDESFTGALDSAAELQKIPVAQYDLLINGGSQQGDLRRPTVYDFIAHQAIEFYTLDEQIIRGIDAFEITADGPVLSTDSQFLAWKPVTDDADSFALRAVTLYQQLMAFHQNDEDPTAYLAVDLQRLAYGHANAKGQEKTARYESALQRFADQNKQHPVSAEALANLAQSRFDGNDFLEAHRIATVGRNRFENSVGGARCVNLLSQILQPVARLSTETIWGSVGPEFSIAYKNIDEITFRVLKYERDQKQPGGGWHRSGNDIEDRKRILNAPVVKQWDVELAATDDYQVANQKIIAPDDLPKGAYFIVGIAKAGDVGAKNAVDDVLFVQRIWRTDLAHLTRTDYTVNQLDGQVFDAVTGTPVVGAQVNVKRFVGRGRQNQLVDVANLITDADGKYSTKIQNQSHNHRLTITHGDNTLYVVDNNYRRRSAVEKRQLRQSTFFTDRSIYRPGQTIHFKVVCTLSDLKSNQYVVSPNERLSVDLFDINGEVVETVQLRTNDLGSASGSFTAPQNRATGTMRLQVKNSRHLGRTLIRVEEYKRPKFKVDIDKPEESFALNDSVIVTGHALAYSGAPIDGAKVTYRVVRSVRYAGWWYRRCWWAPVNLPQQEIAQGTTKTKTDGSFEVRFDAIADPAADRNGQPTFTYSVSADVTDSSGETRSAKIGVNVGVVSLTAQVKHDDWLTPESPVTFDLSTKTLDGVGQTVTGKLIVRKLTPPKKVHRKMLGANQLYRDATDMKTDAPDLSDYRRWPVGAVVDQQEVTTDQTGRAQVALMLETGAFQVTFETTDPGGEKVSAESAFLVIDPAAKTFPVKIPDYCAVEKSDWQPGETFTAVWGTGYDVGAAYVEVFHRQQKVSSFWTNAIAGNGSTQCKIEFPIEEKHRGGFQIVVTYVRENRFYSHPIAVSVPWTNKKLDVKWEHFVSKLHPGGKETWTAIVSGPGAESSAVEMVAAMYDSSLDQFAVQQWAHRLGTFYQDRLNQRYQFSNQLTRLQMLGRFARRPFRTDGVTHRRFADGIGLSRFYDSVGKEHWGAAPRSASMRSRNAPAKSAPDAAVAMMSKSATMSFNDPDADAEADRFSAASVSEELDDSNAETTGGPDLNQISLRKNLQETAFFYPNLIADADGRVKIEFEVPEALTAWKFMGLAHDAELRTAMLIDEMTTSKDLMVQPNPPRFLREGDRLYFSVKVTNRSDSAQNGTVQLQLNNALDESSVDASFGNTDPQKSFAIPANESRSYHWKLDVPDCIDAIGAITYEVVGASATVSDGEAGMLPVLSKRILVTESLPLSMRGNQRRTFTFEQLEKMDRSDSLKNQSLTVQMTSNPSWYAVMALPYLMEYPHQCSEQTFNRLYANALGRRIVTSNPRIKTIFEQWRGTDALKSPLEKNDDLRNVMIAESPWLIDGRNDSQARRNVGLLFDTNRLDSEVKESVNRLAQMQLPDGSWPWFSGGPSNDYLTLYITTGFGRLRKLGGDVDVTSAIKALTQIDSQIKRRYDRLVEKEQLDQNNLSSATALYLYGRSFFLEDQAISDLNRPAFEYFLQQAKTHWGKVGSRQSQAHIAIALKRSGDPQTANAIMKSLTERSLRDDQLGQYWTESKNSWFWHQAPIETQALLIEAYDEVLGDADSVQECKIWLLKQKQTQSWKTTKSTADAVYALLLRGTDALASSKLVGVTVGGKKIQPDKIEAGTGFTQQKFIGGEIRSDQKTIEVEKPDDGIAWGSVHWRYLEDVAKIEPYEGTPLTLKKKLFIKKNTDDGPEISPVVGPVEIGDELVTRVEIRADRDMEFVHLKDYRGSGTEPVNVLSQYKSRDGLWYYQSTRDTASHFFIDYLRKGTYVFETSVRVQQAGTYQTGIAEIQCMYAPEFNNHSGSVEIKVKQLASSPQP